MKTYTFTEAELKALLQSTLDRFTDQDGVFDFSPAATAKSVVIDEALAHIEPGNDIPFGGSLTEDEIFSQAAQEEPTCPQCGYDNLEQYGDSPVFCPRCSWFETNEQLDNISPAALGLQSEA